LADQSIGIGADHRGYQLKERLKTFLEEKGYKVVDFGTFDPEPCDYPDIAFRLGEAIANHQVPRGVLICGSGIGMAIAANKLSGVRAAQAFNPELARRSRQDTDSNVLSLAGDFLSPEEAQKILEAWLNTPFAGGRHQRRVEKIIKYERAQTAIFKNQKE
jgi:ribose 5-phosphate isomerase B